MPLSFDQRFQLANQLWKTRKVGDARAAFLALLEEAPDSAHLHERLGAVYARDKDFDKAQRHFAHAVELAPDLAWPYVGLGDVAAKLGQYDEALDYYRRAEALNQSIPWPHVGRAEINEARGFYAEARENLERAIALAPNVSALPGLLRSLDARARERSRSMPVEILRWESSGGNSHSLGIDRWPSISVVCWDISHNPVGRGLTLAELARAHGETELVGPMFPRLGKGLWPPLRDSRPTVPIRAFEARSFRALVEGAVALVSERPCDIAWVSKSRLPSLLIGMLYKLIHGARVVCDIDDDELAFVGASAGMTLDEFIASSEPSDWDSPYSMRWTQLAQSMIPWADAVSVCNPVLQRQHGGILVRHARDDAVFDPAKYDRTAIRSEFGFALEDRVILFLGTPRRHKGIIELAAALAEIGDPNVVLCVIGTTLDESLLRELASFRSVRLSTHADQPLSRLPELNAMADIVCTIQDPDSPISQAQTPAKLTDALAMGTPVVATPVEPIGDFVEAGAVVASPLAELAVTLKRMLAEGPARQQVERARSFFEEELSYTVNKPRAGKVLEAASERTAGDVPCDFLRLLRHIDANMPGTLDPAVSSRLRGAVPTGRRVGAVRSVEEGLNVVFFWKQNDSGLYGRRQDMLLRELSRSPRVRKILHIDAPIAADRLAGMAGGPSTPSPEQGHMIVSNTIARMMKTQDEANIHRRSFVFRTSITQLLGHELPHAESYPNQVEAWMRELDMLDNVLAWVCPVAPGFPDVASRLGFPFVVADVIDDERQWPLAPLSRKELEATYRKTFQTADVAVANCRSVADWLSAEGHHPLVVPNGMETHDDIDSWPVPEDLARLPRPVIAYAGNMSARIDWDLISHVAAARPDWTIVLIGPTPSTEQFRAVVAHPNVHALGAMPYERAIRYLAAADAAMIPHARTRLSDTMNPLKLYVYRSLGIPVVSTPVDNLDDFEGEVRIAPTPGDFLSLLTHAIEERRRSGRSFPDRARLENYSWKTRLATIFKEIDRTFALRARGPLDKTA